MFNKLNIFTDGGARGNPGPAAIGVCILGEDKKKISGFGRTIGIATNNVAEYKAVLAALSWLEKNKEKLAKDICVSFFLDSKLAYSQISGFFKIKDANLRQLLFSVREIEAELGFSISYNYIPREKNKQADKLVNMALDRVRLD